MSDWLANFSDFHFLRPWWFLGLVPVAALLVLYRWRKQRAGSWENIINPALLPFLLQGETHNNARTGWLVGGLATAWIACCLSLAGPSWQQLPQPVHKQDSALIVVLDLSPSMLAEDISPSRLVRARYKLIDILNSRKEGFAALVVYGGEAHTLSPLTEDSNTIISLVPILHPTLLPEYGSNAEEAIAMAIDLANNGGYQQADILLITDGVARSGWSSIGALVAQTGKFRLSILGVGTEEGAPIPMGDGGFVKDRSGSILIPKLESASLRQLAANNGGNYRSISADDSDIKALLASTDLLFPDATRELDRSFDLWDDQGFWLILLLLPALMMSFRKGTVVLVLLGPMLTLSDPASASVWDDLWRTSDQQGSEALQSGDAARAQTLFENDQWRASAAYRAGDYDSAISDYSLENTADSHYNRGNALAKSGDFEAAIDAYNRALELQPEMPDALANRDLLEKLQQQQEQNQDQENQENQQQNQENGQQDQQQNQQNQQQNKKEQSDQQESDASEQNQQQSEQSQNPQEQPQDQAEPQPEDQQQEQQAQEQQTEQESEASQEQQLSEEDRQNQQEIEQMLRRVPDDPGGLLRQKFLYQSRQRALQQRRPKPPNEQERW